MATSSQNRAFQAYKSHNFNNHPATKKPQISTITQPLVFGRIPYSSIKTTIETVSPTPSSADVNSLIKPVSMSPKRRSSSTSMSNLLPRRKSLQMTALASQRQALWISIAKNAQTNTTQSSSFPLRQPAQTNLLRKKLLRLLLVFSYLLSISLFAIALATFYGFFWSGYGTTQIETQLTNDETTHSLTSNTTLIDMDFPLEDN